MNEWHTKGKSLFKKYLSLPSIQKNEPITKSDENLECLGHHKKCEVGVEWNRVGIKPTNISDELNTNL